MPLRCWCAALAVVVLAVACGDEGEDGATQDAARTSLTTARAATSAAADGNEEPVPWAVVEELVSSPTGSYKKDTKVNVNGRRLTILQEWVAYDLDQPLIDRRVGVVDPENPPDLLPTREVPSLRFVYDDTTAFMWNPGAEASCGTPWVEMPPEAMAEATGVPFEATDLLVIEPVEVLRNATDPEVVRSDRDNTYYEITVSAAAGVPLRVITENPDAAEKLINETTTARVRLPRQGGPIDLGVDISDAVARATRKDLGGMLIEWNLTVDEPQAPRRPEGKVAEPSCLS